MSYRSYYGQIGGFQPDYRLRRTGFGTQSLFQKARKGKEFHATDFCLELSKWDQRKGDFLMQKQEVLNTELSKHKSNSHITSAVMADNVALAYNYMVEFTDKSRCNDPERLKWMKEVFASEAWQDLRRSTTRDYMMARVAAENLAKQWLAYKNDEESGDASGPPSGEDAASEAKTEVEELNELKQSWGFHGSRDAASDLKEIIKKYHEVKDNRLLRGILRRAGAYRRLAMSMQHKKRVKGVDEVTDIVHGNNIPKTLTQEKRRAVMSDEGKVEFVKKYSEKKLLNRAMTSMHGTTQGPIGVVVDESGSMCGEEIIQAKSIALSMAHIAESQGRKCYLYGFCAEHEILPHYGETLNPGEDNAEKLMSWTGQFREGGTRPDVPFKDICKMDIFNKEKCGYKGKADLIVITDGEMDISPQMKEDFINWREKNKVQVFGIVIGQSSKFLDDLCTFSWSVDDLQLGQDAVGEVFSI